MFTTAIDDKTDSKKKIQKSKFLKEGLFPIIDQGQVSIAGYTNDKNLIRKFNKPVIVFGDHTLIFKYIDFEFIQGADGIRILMPKNEICTKFFYYYCKYLPLPHKGYSRHYKLLKQCYLPLPPLKEQSRIVQKIETCFEKINAIEKNFK